jgi:hypothetical protein
MFKWQICYTQMTCMLHFTINVRKSHPQPQCTLQIVCEVRVLFTFLSHAGSSIQNVSCMHLHSVNFTLPPTPQKSNASEKRDEVCARFSVIIPNNTYVQWFTNYWAQYFCLFVCLKYSICCPLDSASRGRSTTCYTHWYWLSWFPP